MMKNNSDLPDKYLILRNCRINSRTRIFKIMLIYGKIKSPTFFKVEDFQTAKHETACNARIYYSGLVITICLSFKCFNCSKGIKSASAKVMGRIDGIAPAQ